jgi:hypothetical protein
MSGPTFLSTEADLDQGRVTLEFDGYQRRSDVLLARLQSVTSAVTG